MTKLGFQGDRNLKMQFFKHIFKISDCFNPRRLHFELDTKLPCEAAGFTRLHPSASCEEASGIVQV